MTSAAIGPTCGNVSSMTRLGALLLVPVLALAAACSDGGEDASGAGDVSSGQDVADLIGCTGFEATSEELYVAEGGPCDLDGESVSVYYFADQDALTSYVSIAEDFGGVYLVGDNWAVEAPIATLESLQTDVGGELSNA